MQLNLELNVVNGVLKVFCWLQCLKH